MVPDTGVRSVWPTGRMVHATVTLPNVPLVLFTEIKLETVLLKLLSSVRDHFDMLYLAVDST